MANRGYGWLSSVTKIAGDERFCIQRKGSAKLNTSRDLNNNGTIEPSEVLAVGEDDCVLFTTPVCVNTNVGARALAIDAKGDVWVGCYADQTVYQMDSRNGHIKGEAIQLGMPPYGAIVDSQQNLWLTNSTSSGALQGVNTRTREVLNKDKNEKPVPITPDIGKCHSYGLAVDRADRVWVSGGCIYNHYAATKKWSYCNLGGDFSGIVVDGDNNVYASKGNTLVQTHWDDATAKCDNKLFRSVNLGDIGAKGVGLDIDGNVWTVGSKQAARVNPKTGAVTGRTQRAQGHSRQGSPTLRGYQLDWFCTPPAPPLN